jgi:hypothetical protein
MIYLQSFHMLSKDEDEDFFLNVKSPTFKTKNYRTCYSSQYPFVMFRESDLPDFVILMILQFFTATTAAGKAQF